MGAWGTAIFSDDIAADVRDDFKDKIAAGKTPLDATNEMIAENQAILEDNDDAAVFWLSLAAAQWKLGRLVDFVKQKAIEIIDNGQELERWREDLKQLKQRKLVLEKLKVQLTSEQPAPKKIYPRFISDTILEIGDLVLYKHPSGKNVYLRVVGIPEDKGGKRPYMHILNYFDNTPLNTDAIKTLDKVIQRGNFFITKTINVFSFGCYDKREGEPINKLLILEKDNSYLKAYIGPSVFIWWKDFDEYLEQIFGSESKILKNENSKFSI